VRVPWVYGGSTGLRSHLRVQVRLDKPEAGPDLKKSNIGPASPITLARRVSRDNLDENGGTQSMKCRPAVKFDHLESEGSQRLFSAPTFWLSLRLRSSDAARGCADGACDVCGGTCHACTPFTATAPAKEWDVTAEGDARGKFAFVP
jgi:hypothetical protein